MIYIYSKDKDKAVEEVINWILYKYQQDIFRVDVTSDLFVDGITLNKESISCIIRNKYGAVLDLDKVTGAMFHGGGLFTQLAESPDIETSIVGTILSHDSQSIIYFINENISAKQIPHIGTFKNFKYIKLYFLMLAQRVGIDIPKTLLTSYKEIAKKHVQENETITKSLDYSIHIESDEWVSLGHRTQLVNDKDLDSLADKFYPTLFQEKLEKEFELRIYFLKDTFYPMAIFSQSNKVTQVDFRAFGSNQAVRHVPYKLPHEIEQKLRRLIEQTGFKTGSIDMVVTPEKKYVFLELNPFGQMAFLSSICNYNIEKKIAEYLTNFNQSNGTSKNY